MRWTATPSWPAVRRATPRRCAPSGAPSTTGTSTAPSARTPSRRASTRPSRSAPSRTRTLTQRCSRPGPGVHDPSKVSGPLPGSAGSPKRSSVAKVSAGPEPGRRAGPWNSWTSTTSSRTVVPSRSSTTRSMLTGSSFPETVGSSLRIGFCSSPTRTGSTGCVAATLSSTIGARGTICRSSIRIPFSGGDVHTRRKVRTPAGTGTWTRVLKPPMTMESLPSWRTCHAPSTSPSTTNRKGLLRVQRSAMKRSSKRSSSAASKRTAVSSPPSRWRHFEPRCAWVGSTRASPDSTAKVP